MLERELRGVMFAHSAFDDVRINEPTVRHTKRKAKVETLKSLARTCIPSPLSGRRGSPPRRLCQPRAAVNQTRMDAPARGLFSAACLDCLVRVFAHRMSVRFGEILSESGK